MCNTASKMLYTSEIFMKLSGVLKINKGCVHRPTTTVNLRIEKTARENLTATLAQLCSPCSHIRSG